MKNQIKTAKIESIEYILHSKNADLRSFLWILKNAMAAVLADGSLKFTGRLSVVRIARTKRTVKKMGDILACIISGILGFWLGIITVCLCMAGKND